MYSSETSIPKCLPVADFACTITIKKTLKIALKKSDYAEVRFDFLKSEQVP